MDIDFFKNINDSYGHAVGDVTHKKPAAVCRETLREVDIIGRLGGEEFAVLLPETGKEKAIEVAGRLKRAISRAKIPLENGLTLHFTVSIGVAAFSSTDDTIDRLLNSADQFLYEAKRSRRNKVCFDGQSQ